MSDLKVGDTIWHFDINWCVYPERDSRGVQCGGPIYREHWRPVKIVGETKRSWVTDWFASKAPKCGGCGWAFTSKEVEDDVYVHENRYKLGQRVCACVDVEKLRAISAILEAV